MWKVGENKVDINIMDIKIITELFYNLALLLTLAIIYIVFQNKASSGEMVYNVLFSLAVGTAGILIMSSGVQLEHGVFFDTRSILIGVVGMFFGLLPTIVAGIMMILYRILLGGDGLYAGIFIIVTSGIWGMVWHRYRIKGILASKKAFDLEFYLFGMIIHINMMICILALPREDTLNLVITLFWPALILYPVGTYFLCALMKNQYLHNELLAELMNSGERLNNIIDGTNAGTWEWNVQTGEQRINARWGEIIGYTLEELAPISVETWKKYCHPEDLERSNSVLAQVFEKKKLYYQLEFRMKHKDGHWVWISSRGRVNSWTREGKPLQISGTHTDISESKNLEEEIKASRRQFIDIIEFLPDATLAIDINKRVIIWNKAIEEMTGIPSSEMLGKGEYAYTVPFYGMPRAQLMDLVLEKNVENVEQAYSGIKRVGETVEAEAYCPALYNNRGAWIFMKVSPLHDQNGNVIGVIESIRDISDKKQAEEALKRSEERFRIMFEEAPLGIGVFEVGSGQALQLNRKFVEIIGYSKEEMYQINWKDISHPQDMEENNNYRNLMFSGVEKGFNMKKRYFKKDGSTIWINLTITLLDAVKDKNPRELCMIEDITEKVKREEEILYLNCHDVLTGLYNRMFFEEEKKRLDTERQLPLSVIIGDVDGLKLINDGFGYASGDNLLVKAGGILSKSCRTEDIVSRIGGDEFCILLPQTTSEKAREICKRIHDLCEETSIDLGSGSVKVSISVGHDTKTRRDQDLSGIIVSAENSMRRRKLLERKSVRSDLMSSIKATMLEKSYETAEHAERLVTLSRGIGEKIGLSDDKIFELELAATLHDIGKMSIDLKILIKPGKLTDEEWEEIKKHPEAGYRIAQATSELMPISEYILAHHERWDGNGYPQGLKNKEIPLISRIINVVDSYDAMTSTRPYGETLTKEQAILEMRKCSGTQFDPEIIKVFVEEVLAEVKE